MVFTRSDFEKIKKALVEMSIKDTQFSNAETPLNSYDTITLVQNGQNRQITVQKFIEELAFLHDLLPNEILRRLQEVEEKVNNIGDTIGTISIDFINSLE